MEKKEYLIPETTLFYSETESAILDYSEVGETDPDQELGAKKLTDKLFDDEEEL